MSQLLPADIGAAAAYEAYRTWKYNSSLYAPLSADRMMQREGLIATAMAEGEQQIFRSFILKLTWVLWYSSDAFVAVHRPRHRCLWSASCLRVRRSHSHNPGRPCTHIPLVIEINPHMILQFLSYAGMAGGAGLVPSPMGSPYGGAGTLAPGGYGTYGVPYVGSAGSYRSYSPSGGQQIAAPAGATVVVSGRSHSHRSHSRGRSHSRDRDHHHHHHGSHSHSSRRSSSHSHHHLLPLPSHHSDHHHHHHHSPHRRRSVEIIQPAGGAGYGYAPYYGSAGYSGYGNAYGGGYGYGRYGYPYSSSYHDSGCVIS